MNEGEEQLCSYVQYKSNTKDHSITRHVLNKETSALQSQTVIFYVNWSRYCIRLLT